MELAIALWVIDIFCSGAWPFLGLLALVVSIVCFFASNDTQDVSEDERRACLKLSKATLVCAIPLLSIALFFPSQKTAYLMLGAIVGEKTVEEIGKSEIFTKVMLVVNKKLDEELKVVTENK